MRVMAVLAAALAAAGCSTLDYPDYASGQYEPPRDNLPDEGLRPVPAEEVVAGAAIVAGAHLVADAMGIEESDPERRAEADIARRNQAVADLAAPAASGPGSVVQLCEAASEEALPKHAPEVDRVFREAERYRVKGISYPADALKTEVSWTCLVSLDGDVQDFRVDS